MYKTGEEVPQTGYYKFIRYIDGMTTPTPCQDECVILLRLGDPFPNVKSTRKNAWWEFFK